MWRLLLPLLLVLAGPARACDVALALLIDTSNSIDEGEWRIQSDGLADALSDPEVVDALVQGQVALTVIQWSGPGQHVVTHPWDRVRTALDAARIAAAVRAGPRAFRLSGTAPGDALAFALDQFSAAPPDCARRVVDVSGDGTPNGGRSVREQRTRAERLGVTVNAIAIEGIGVAITNFYRRAVITGDGFVMTARRHGDYPPTLRAKILREVARVLF
ncbi:MAG: DUF1194 domain-containing protein [Paracoccaceae bacterium]